MITQVSPAERNVGETLASLNFAQRVRTVELGQASKKTESAEIAELKEKLAQYEVWDVMLINIFLFVCDVGARDRYLYGWW